MKYYQQLEANNYTANSFAARCLAISIRQPWAYLIMTGQKKMELRRWSTSYRGFLLIHAPKTIDNDAVDYFGLNNVKLHTGFILGSVRLEQVSRLSKSEYYLHAWDHCDFHRYEEGIYGYVVANPHVLNAPIPTRGQLGRFPVKSDIVVRTILEQSSNVDSFLAENQSLAHSD